MRRWAISLTTLLLFVSACGDDDGGDGGKGGEPAAEQEAVSVEVAAIPPGSLVPTWPLLVAEAEGFFEDENLDAKLNFTFDGGQLLAGEQVDLLSDAADSGVIATSQGQGIRMVAPLLLKVTDGLMVQPDISSVADLEGATIRTSGFGTDEFIARKFIEENGGPVASIEFVGIEDDAAALAQLKAGKIQGGMFGLGVLLAAEESGDYKVLAKLGDLPAYPWNIIQTTESFASSNPEAVDGFANAIRTAVEFMQDPVNEQAVKEVALAEGVGLEEAFVDAAYELVAGGEVYETGDLTVADLEPSLEFLEFAGEDIGDVDLQSLLAGG